MPVVEGGAVECVDAAVLGLLGCKPARVTQVGGRCVDVVGSGEGWGGAVFVGVSCLQKMPSFT